MLNIELERIINQKLDATNISDYAPNGLQVEGRPQVKKIITGVTASQALIDYAVAQQADALLVHHGYFWKSENPCILGMKGRRIKTLLQNDLNLFAYHLPLDIHPSLGNNAQLAELLGIKELQPLESGKYSIPMKGKLVEPVNAKTFAALISAKLGRACLHCPPFSASGIEETEGLIQHIGICTGGGQGYIDLAASQGCDAFISGEVSEQTVHSAREQGIHFFAAGHHATERYGVKVLGEWLAAEYGFDVEFKDIDNPA
ncbi:Nif3-like dinuclear metal center hexameric protein [Mergibacter septicus]|uniref:GTP cyclohydrolase 1 type 2 homolog n=1 Tax=Mergibacter septicus TaxID=221402 RepID=A0A8D4J0G2_9PAST|nr:Nif3-like dinuclear metal center hexameric protein [Mergibacter septicus]AWX15632.1 Nif3-like dinuclear metal center hexameric protein [Mergibacter septicus]QDJ14886.1 Nif3-like dinuclear metal center hexameric protein [Mergibacter septicus]UTU47688.1 Nif3-like dinuclear metal center hexameric protein [Mergibacter septicus]WMR96706.1 Nif3-like dinuclear metal center hexameric protein [Mergibacter septicus]